jgi:hypothetical protein
MLVNDPQNPSKTYFIEDTAHMITYSSEVSSLTKSADYVLAQVDKTVVHAAQDMTELTVSNVKSIRRIVKTKKPFRVVTKPIRISTSGRR